MFVSFDGVDGVGKSTQVGLFVNWLRQSGHDVVSCRDPGSTPLGEEVRRILLDSESIDIHRRSEMFLYMAARSQMVEEVIRPALAAGKTIVSDRFLLANVVYQGHAGGLNVDELWQVGRIATSGTMPDWTFVLDMDVDTAFDRIDRERDRMESQGRAFRESVRRGFLTEARRFPEDLVIIDASREVSAVQASIQQVARERGLV